MRRTRPAGLLFGALFLTLALLAAACGGSSSDDNTASSGSGGSTQTTTNNVKQGGTLTFGANEEIAGFNVNTSEAATTASVMTMDSVWPSVFRINPQFEPVLDTNLMVSVEQTSADPQTIVYKIRPDANWSDGTPISADDLIYQWQMSNGNGKDIDGSEADVASTTGYQDIKSCTASDNNKTVTCVFAKPFGDWKSLFSQNIVPAHIAKKVGWNHGFDKFDPSVVISGGPFAVQSYDKGKSLTLVRNDKYWGPKAHLDRIVFKYIDSNDEVAALQNKDVDLIYPQPQIDLVQQVKNIPDVNTELNFGLSFEHLDFNFKNPLLSQYPVRQAIALALDRDTLVKRTVGQFDSRAKVLDNRQFVNNQPEYKDTSGGAYDKPDVAKAKQVLQQAGFTQGGDGIFAKGGQRLSFRLTTIAGNELRRQTQQLIQAQLKAAGIDIVPGEVDSKAFGGALTSGNFDIAEFGWNATPFPSSNRSIYTTGAGQNYGNYSNPKVDDLYTRAQAETDHAKATDLYNQADAQEWADLATIPLYQKPTFIAFRNTFVNIGDNASSEGIFWNAQQWGLKA